MRFNTVFALSGILILAGTGIGAQTISRWLRVPYGSNPPAILRHHLGAPQSPGSNFQFIYEKTPVRPLERLINRAIPEAAPAPVVSEELPGVGQSALKLEELNREAEEILANPPASTSFAHLFLQQQKKPENASQSEIIASIGSELPTENTATGSFLPPASGTATASGTTVITATGSAGLPALPTGVSVASGAAAGK